MLNQPTAIPQYAVGDEVQLIGDTTKKVHKISEVHPDPLGIVWIYDLGSFGSLPENQLRSVDEVQGLKQATVSFESVIIEDEKREQIVEALEQINQQELIFKTWGFEDTIEKGRGVSLLFYGAPGTGKTLMAQAIANKMGYKLVIMAAADIESSAPGQSERNIREAFKQAKGKKTIILFDECDSLIYSRSNVGAILGAQINELLSSIEKFDGITIFTTNRLGVLDEAVNRRLALKLEFSMPDHAQRIKIWKRMFPSKAPLSSDINWEELAEAEVTGGYIKNVALRAARMAAVDQAKKKKKEINHGHLEKALALELESMEDFEEARAAAEGRPRGGSRYSV